MRNDQQQAARWTLGDLVRLGGAAALLLSFFILPWATTGDETVTAWNLSTSAAPRPLMTQASATFLIGVAGVVGALFSIIGILSPRRRKVMAAVVLVAGILGALHYVLLLINNSQNIGATIEPLSIGFWVALIGALALIIQIGLQIPAPPDAINPAGFYFLLPGVVWVLLFTLFPLIYSLALAFTDMRLGREANFIGLQNFSEIPADLRVQETLFTSAFLSVGSVILTLVLGTAIAALFNRAIPGLRLYRTIMTIPLFTAPIALGFLGKVLFNEENGPINYMLRTFGLAPQPWFTDPVAARVGVLIVDVWQWTPFVFIVVLAAMQSISDELYESARLDTSSWWATFRSITFPLITPALGTVAMLRLVETLKILDIPLAMTDGGPGTATQTYSYYTYVKGIGRSFDLGYASAMAYVLVILAIIISSIYFWRVRARFA